MRQIASDVFVEGETDHGIILHAPASTIVRVAARLGFRAKPHHHVGRELATLYFTAAKAGRVEEMLAGTVASTIPAPAECAEGR